MSKFASSGDTVATGANGNPFISQVNAWLRQPVLNRSPFARFSRGFVTLVVVVNIALGVWCAVQGTPGSWWLAFATLLNGFVYGFARLSHRIFLVLFLGSMALFLFARPVLQILFRFAPSPLVDPWLTQLGWILFVTLIAVLGTYRAAELLTAQRSRIRRTRVTAPRRTLSDDAKSDLRAASLAVFLVMMVGAVGSAATRLHIAMTEGYAALYTEEFSARSGGALQTLFSYMAFAAFVALMCYLATMPPLRFAAMTMVAWLCYTGALLLAGQRKEFSLTLLVFLGYLVVRARNRGVNPAARRRIAIGAAVIVAVVTPLSLIVENVRGVSNDVAGNTPLLVRFLQSQGVSVTTITNTLAYADQLPDQFYLGEFAHSGLLAYLFGLPIYGGNSVERAEHGGSLSHSLSHVVLNNQYLDGHGTGSSFVAEGLATFGMFGVGLVGVLFGLLVHQLDLLGTGSLPANVVRLLIAQEVLWGPRGSATYFISVLLAPTTIITIITIVAGAWVLAWRKRHRLASSRVIDSTEAREDE